ncbi:XK-related protein 4 [Chelonia mydas]|uniref:XK-related protein n=1 Tax=Chelonia mydas TaxID=8469 RepID=M7B8D1_CHEMY|nr:XK-related protein 4 [Chelonia mydas]
MGSGGQYVPQPTPLPAAPIGFPCTSSGTSLGTTDLDSMIITELKERFCDWHSAPHTSHHTEWRTDLRWHFYNIEQRTELQERRDRSRKKSLTAAASLVSLAWALASYQKALRDSRDDKKPISYMAVIIQFCWHFFTIAARVITFALFASVFQLYFGIFIVLHWCIMTFWIVHCETEFCITKWEEIVFDMVVGIIYIFSWFNVKEGRTRCRLFIYYFVILLENTALSALWYLYKAPLISDAFAIPALCVVFSSFLTGIVFMLMYYAFFHPNGPRFGQSPSCACEDPVAAFTMPPEVATNTLRSISNNRSVTSDRDQKLAERDGCVPVFQVRPTAPSTPSSRPPRIEESVIKIDLFRNRYPAWERHVLDRSLRKAILAFECSPAPPRLQYKDDALIQERLEYETTL